MYRHILVPVDGTDACIEAIGQAVEFAQSIGARITFLPVLHQYARQGADAVTKTDPQPTSTAVEIEERAWELLARAEAAARAQGVPCSSAALSNEAPFPSIVGAAREHGCDLICMAPHRPPAGTSEPRAEATGVLDAGQVAVLICPIDQRPAVSRTIGVLLDEHRAIANELHAWLRVVRAAGAYGTCPGREAMRENVHRLRNLQARRHQPREEACLFPKLRESTSVVDAELDELERQHQRDEQLLDELAEIVERGTEPGAPTGRLEQMVSAYAQFTWERMGREEGVVLPAARRHLRDRDWMEITAAFAALTAHPSTAHP
jgi:nucleotide-binding universal stress UspA family protein/hemerythrin-like domain-containing protein